jgi:uncharacterized DUF497 family protein
LKGNLVLFEWDDDKRLSNLAKHRLDFQRATELFDGRLVVEAKTDHPFEVRFKTTGLLDGVFVTAVWTRRDNAIRLISVRRAHDDEERKYYENEP